MTSSFWRLLCDACGRTAAIATGPAAMLPAQLGWRDLPARCLCTSGEMTWRRDADDVKTLLSVLDAGTDERPGTMLVSFIPPDAPTSGAASSDMGAPTEAEGAPHGRTSAVGAAPHSKPVASSATHQNEEAPHDDGRAPGFVLGVRSDIPLGARVRIVDARDIVGTVVATTHHLDGSSRLVVDYWSNGSRESLACEARELEVLR